MKPLDTKYAHHVGIDESGRGCVGGSMFFVGCKLKPDTDIESIAFVTDSKKTTSKQREEMYFRLLSLVDYKLVRYSAEEIDRYSLATCLKDALENLKSWAGSTPIIYDGSTNYGVKGVETMVKADSKISLVSAASIIAKYNKDLESVRLEEQFPEFSFSKHKGYINPRHIAEIQTHGYTKHHRRTYRIKALQTKDIPEYTERETS